ncbi:DUF4224 domain-containing protein [Paraburkholderia phenoliruptrix]|uniref:DUF4224 domain-containing protein n=1 Tax=Paraburkholderia phenoliruptrix TaxID=252970 RepID=UPI0034CF8817
MDTFQQAFDRMGEVADLAHRRGADKAAVPLRDLYLLLATARSDIQPRTEGRLMSASDLEGITGLKRHTKQADWFKREYGVEVVRRDDRTVVMTWAIFEALNAKRYGITLPDAAREKRQVELCYD